jgi:hypothetical protein
MNKNDLKKLVKAVVSECIKEGNWNTVTEEHNKNSNYAICQKCKGTGSYTAKLKNKNDPRSGVAEPHTVSCDAPGCENGRVNLDAYYKQWGIGEEVDNISLKEKVKQLVLSPDGKHIDKEAKKQLENIIKQTHKSWGDSIYGISVTNLRFSQDKLEIDYDFGSLNDHSSDSIEYEKILDSWNK